MAVSGCMEGKVIAITGAGRGIGKEIALLAAKEGAKVVVNDLGGSTDGDGADASTAQAVVDEIASSGGEAVANCDSVDTPKGAQNIIDTAMDIYGQIDAVVNNAGILRDRIFHRMSILDFEMVLKVHLFGSFYVARAAATHFREQNSGSFVHFTSTSGLIGNLGQSNYAAAKMGIIGLSKGIAMDMEKFNVRSNCIAPFAWSRLVGTIPADTMKQRSVLNVLKKWGRTRLLRWLCIWRVTWPRT